MYQAVTVQKPYGSSVVKLWAIYDCTTKHIAVAQTAFLVARTIYDGNQFTTVRGYAYTLTTFLNTLSRNQVDWRKITDHQMRQYFEGVLFKHRNLTAQSLNNHIIIIKEFYQWAETNGWCDQLNRFSFRVSNEILEELEILKGTKASHLPFNLSSQFIDQESFNQFLNFNSGNSSFEINRNEIVLLLGYQCGCRAAEVTSKNNFKTEYLIKLINNRQNNNATNYGFEMGIIGKGRAGGKHRYIWIPDALSRRIRAFLENPNIKNSKYLICSKRGNPLNEQFASSVFSKTKRALLTNSERIKGWQSNSKSFHSLRHSYATNFIMEHGQSEAMKELLRTRMGHKDFSTTQIYITFLAELNRKTHIQRTDRDYDL
jgi:site-specific recombinase XerD